MPCAHSLQHLKIEHWSNLTHGALWKNTICPLPKSTTYWSFLLHFFSNDSLWSYQFTIFWGKVSHNFSSKDTFENPLQEKGSGAIVAHEPLRCGNGKRTLKDASWAAPGTLPGRKVFGRCSAGWSLISGSAWTREWGAGEPGSRAAGQPGRAGACCGESVRVLGGEREGVGAHPRSTSWRTVYMYPWSLSARIAFHGPKTIRLQRRGGPLPSFIFRSKLFTSCKRKHQANLSPSDVLCEGFIITPLLTWAPSETQTTEGVCGKWCIQGERRMEKSGAFLGATPTAITLETVMTTAKPPSCSSFNPSLLFLFFKLEFFPWLY